MNDKSRRDRLPVAVAVASLHETCRLLSHLFCTFREIIQSSIPQVDLTASGPRRVETTANRYKIVHSTP